MYHSNKFQLNDMKKIKILLFTGLLGAFLMGCEKKLIEEPRSILTPDFFSTTQGFQQGLDAAYAGMRLFWGNQDYFTVTVIGTDEFKRGIDGNSDINVYSSGYTASTGVDKCVGISPVSIHNTG